MRGDSVYEIDITIFVKDYAGRENEWKHLFLRFLTSLPSAVGTPIVSVKNITKEDPRSS